MVFSREAGQLKIATFNINNTNKRLHNLTAWLVRAQPDVVCIQELKAEQRAFPTSTGRSSRAAAHLTPSPLRAREKAGSTRALL